MNTKRIGELLTTLNLKIATAESCTGGLIGNLITDVPGASKYFKGGIIAYSNEVKIDILDVSEDIIEKYGAVSEECAREMVIGVCKLFKAEVGVSTTGIAGPSGGSKEKPVGLVFIGMKIKNRVWVDRFQFKGERREIKRQIAEKVIALLIRRLEFSK